ncbi:unnamed protein product [Rodentolepis nana]|uniref:BHLH domain-containing protein n=1 Tax=Rodentolepis nana TaxID=102285 RepID=A0A0R3TY79_RODNA|nr:unnamed protein product [Rodentolepis nana]
MCLMNIYVHLSISIPLFSCMYLLWPELLTLQSPTNSSTLFSKKCPPSSWFCQFSLRRDFAFAWFLLFEYIIFFWPIVSPSLTLSPCRDGRRNKGTVLRLSVAYIMDLRNDLVQTTAIRQEANLARTLIPQLSSYIQNLENALKEAEISSGKPLGSITGVLDDGLANYQSLLENWEVLARANAARPTNGESTPQGKMESEMASPLENMQMAFSAGRPPTTASTTTNNSSLSSYHPNAVFVGGPICKQEENDEMCYGGSHVPDDTTDGFFDSTNTNNNNQNNGSTTNSVAKFDLSLMQQMTPSGQVDCGGHENPMQVECQNQ